LIVGGVPSGLILSLQLYRLGFTVILVEQRVGYSRLQVLQLKGSQQGGAALDTVQMLLGNQVWNRLQGKSIGRAFGAGRQQKEELKHIVERNNIRIKDLEFALSVAATEASKASRGRFRIYYGFHFMDPFDNDSSTSPKQGHSPLGSPSRPTLKHETSSVKQAARTL
jgi:hypothetical protein